MKNINISNILNSIAENFALRIKVMDINKELLMAATRPIVFLFILKNRKANTHKMVPTIKVAEAMQPIRATFINTWGLNKEYTSSFIKHLPF